MEGSMVSYPKKSGASDDSQRRSSMDQVEEVEETSDMEEASPEESTWTEILADFSDLRREEEGVEMRRSRYGMSSGSMVSDAGSGPEWKLRNYPNKQMSIMLKKLNFIKANKNQMPYDESLEDTASSPANSPKITMGFDRMDINHKRPDENFDIYHVHGKGRTIGGGHDQVTVDATTRVDPQEMELAQMGYCLLPLTMIMNFHN